MRSSARALYLAAATVLAIGHGVDGAAAQSQVCADLQARLAALDRGGGGQSAETYRAYDASVNQQRAEIDRASAEARRAGCLGGGFLFSTRRPEPKCPQLMATISQMRANLARLSATRDQYANDPYGVSRQRNEILRSLSYNRCGGSYATYNTGGGERGLLATLFGQSSRVRTWGDTGYFRGNLYGTYRTLCVRTCDGYYFPISFSTVPDRFATDQQTCQAMCPGAIANLYVHHNPGEDTDAMVSIYGEPYSVLPTAFRYRSEYDASCTCRSATASTAFDALAQQAAALTLPSAAVAPTPVVPTPYPRPAPGDDPETIANRAGGIVPRPAAPPDSTTVAGVTSDGERRIRVVGPEYYVAQ